MNVYILLSTSRIFVFCMTRKKMSIPFFATACSSIKEQYIVDVNMFATHLFAYSLPLNQPSLLQFPVKFSCIF